MMMQNAEVKGGGGDAASELQSPIVSPLLIFGESLPTSSSLPENAKNYAHAVMLASPSASLVSSPLLSLSLHRLLSFRHSHLISAMTAFKIH